MQSNQIIKNIRLCGSGSNGILLGIPNLNDQIYPTLVNIQKYNFKQIILGGLFATAISNDQRKAWIWGSLKNQLQNDNYICQIPRYLNILNVKKISCGWQHAIILTNQGQIYGFGCNKFNQLKQSSNKKIGNTKKISNYLKQPELLVQSKNIFIKDVCCGFRQSYIIEIDQINKQEKIWGKGQNKNYQIGDSQSKNEDGWILISQQNKIKWNKIGAGKKYLIALDNNNQLWICGSNQFGLVESINQELIKKLQKINTKGQIIEFSVGWTHLITLDRQGIVRSFGRNNFGQLGRMQQKGDSRVMLKQCINKIVSGTQFNFGIGENNKIYGWGWNEHNNICEQKRQVINEPIQIRIEERVNKIVTYGACTIFILQN